jgi:hypothetical protein
MYMFVLSTLAAWSVSRDPRWTVLGITRSRHQNPGNNGSHKQDATNLISHSSLSSRLVAALAEMIRLRRHIMVAAALQLRHSTACVVWE